MPPEPPWLPLRITAGTELAIGTDRWDLRGWGKRVLGLWGQVRPAECPKAEWLDLHISLQRVDGNWIGTLTIGAATWRIRGWGKGSGVLHAEVQTTDWHWAEVERDLAAGRTG